MPFFGRSLKSQKSPADLVKSLKDALKTLETVADHKLEKAREDVGKNLMCIKNMLYDVKGAEPASDHVVAQFSQEFYSNNLLLLLLQQLHRIDFEGKKHVVQIFKSLLQRRIDTRLPTVEYIYTKPEILFTLLACYEQTHPDIVLNSGNMLRECVRYQPLAKILLNSEKFFKFFDYVDGPTFEIASDAFGTFKELLTHHTVLSMDFLVKNYDKFFIQHYQRLLHSDNYVTRRQSIKLLGEILLERHNYVVMMRYVAEPEYLKLIMGMLKEKSRNIQFEAFHVFKAFVANPEKPKRIHDILLRNQSKLVDFLTHFQNERPDEEFSDEKAYLVKLIKELKPLPEAKST